MKTKLKWIVLIAIFFGGYALYTTGQSEEFQVNYEDPRLVHFLENNERTVKLTGEKDVDNDGVEDLIIVWYNDETDMNFISCVVGEQGNYRITGGETKAPYENLTIEFKDIDDKPPMEFIVSGSRNGNYGYAIYRVEDMVVSDLFGEGMDECW